MRRAFKYLYDGDCSICRTFQAMVEKLDNGLGRVAFVDIANQASKPTGSVDCNNNNNNVTRA